MYRKALSCISILRNNGFKAYLAGGCVRDMLLGIEPMDYDIATDAKPDQIGKIFKEAVLTWGHLGVVILPYRKNRFEITTFRGDGEYDDARHPVNVVFTNEQEDAQRRDFTINGIFYDTENDKIIDYVNGQEDLKNGIIRAIGNPEDRFNEDHLRIIRAIRFAARFGFCIEKDTYNAILKYADKIETVSNERIYMELTKILVAENAVAAFELLFETRILEKILKEVHALKGVRQPPEFHPEGDVWDHTMLMLRNLGKTDKPVLAWAVLLHDIGKPATYMETDRIRFNEHSRIGSHMASDILRRFHCPNKDRETIISLIDQHMKFMAVKEMRLSTLKRFLRQDDFDLHLELHRLDCISSHSKLDNYDFTIRMIKELAKETADLKPKLLVNGDDLIELGFKPGPLFKDILRSIEDEQLEGNLVDRENAIDWIKKRYLR